MPSRRGLKHATMRKLRSADAADRNGNFLAGGGEMGELIRRFDWAATPVGPVEVCPQSLRTALSIMLPARYPMYLAWGPEFIQFYNDAYRPILGANKHPRALGQGTPECFREIWDFIGPMFQRIMDGGEATGLADQLLCLERSGFLEECYFTFSYSPIRDESGGVGGVFVTCNEVTAKVIGERRLKLLRDLAAELTGKATVHEVHRVASQVLAQARHDLPFVLLYLNEDELGLRLVEGIGCAGVGEFCPEVIALDAESPWPVAAVLREGAGVRTCRLPAGALRLIDPAWPEAVNQAGVIAIPQPGSTRPAGLLVAGISPRLQFDEAQAQFLKFVASQIGEALAAARAKEEEHRRAAALAELDRAKTAFFANVSHEFRTPMTLMLGPLEDLLQRSDGELPPVLRGQVEMAHRNCRRLLKLVNSLLEFSRLEAGRVKAVYEPTDLAALTAELASQFRSAMELGGLKFEVDCAPLPEAVFVDREMWEKIVLNLLSNAFKFTLQGRVAVAMRKEGGQVKLTVQDTGTGIPANEIDRVFQRFHRVKETRGRSFEGTGIGLALVQEMVRLHGGTVAVCSEPGVGSTFTVTVPFGRAHLPGEQVQLAGAPGLNPDHANPYVEEAIRWVSRERSDVPDQILSTEQPAHFRSVASHPPESRPQVLVVDDNADVRDYLSRILESSYRVRTAADGQAALELIGQGAPDLVLADVMTPRLDGFGLLRALRAAPSTQTLPIIMLSARAGEESRVEGLQAGADDYLIKPFSARELLARVESQLKLAQLRREAEWALKRTNDELERRVEERTRDLAAANEKLRELTQAAQQLTSARDLARVMQILRTTARRLAGADGVTVVLREGDQCHYIDEDAIAPLWKGKRFPMSSCISGWVMLHNQPATIEDIHQDSRIPVDAYRPTFVQSLAMFPMRITEPLGAIGCYWAQSHTTTAQEKQLMSVLADAAARAIDSVRAYAALEHELAERRLVEKALRMSESRLKFTLEASHIGTWELDLETLQSKRTLIHDQIFGYEILLPSWTYEIFLEHVVDEDRPEVDRLFREATEKRADWDFECRIRRRDGVVRWIWAAGSHECSEGGRPLRILGLVQDITERRLAEDAIRASERQQHQLSEQLEAERCRLVEAQAVAKVGSWETDLSDLKVTWSAETHRIFETDPNRFTPTHPAFLEFVHPEDRESVDAAFAASLDQDSMNAIEHRILLPDGRTKAIEERWRIIHDKAGRPVRAAGTCQDITPRKEAEEALRESEERLRLMVESVQDYAIILLDAKGYVANWNSGAERIKGYAAGEILGRHFSIFYRPEDIKAGLPAKVLSEALAKGHYEYEGWRVRKNGSHFWGDIIVSAVHDAKGHLRGFVKVTRDMTERRNAEEALRKSKLALQSIFDAAPLALLSFDLEGRTTSWSRGAERIFGWTEAEAIGRLCPAVPLDLQSDFREMIRRVADHGCETLVRLRQKKSGELIYAKLSPAPLRDSEGRVSGIMVVLVDITEMRRAEEELRDQQARLSQLSHQLLSAQELERRRIARELHDHLGQSLALLQIKLQATQELNSLKAMVPALAENITVVERLHEQVRNLSLDLRPSVLDDLGLVPALRWHVDRLAQSTSLSISFVSDGSVGRHAVEVETAFFRVAQEALANILRHSRAKMVRVCLSKNSEEMILRIADDGVGFDPATARQQAAHGQSMGLLSMEERMKLVGGEFSITSRPGEGTEVVVRCPFAPGDSPSSPSVTTPRDLS